uniref:Uncharacterized protein n=1 Tax=Oryza glumipatula TaxID=40148 RepID=A0A0E0B754_9ORYZ
MLRHILAISRVTSRARTCRRQSSPPPRPLTDCHLVDIFKAPRVMSLSSLRPASCATASNKDKQVVAGESSLSNSGKAGSGSYHSSSGPYHFPPRKKKGETDDDEVDYDYIPLNRCPQINSLCFHSFEIPFKILF